jgi:hypothetical protein
MKKMKKFALLMLILVFVLAIPGLTAAQMHGGSGQHMGTGQYMGSGQHMMGPGMRNNFGTMSHMMGDMHQMLQSGRLTPEQEQQMLEWMDQMGGMMQQWRGPQGAQLEAQHRQQLQQMQQNLQRMKNQIQKR